MKPRLEFFGPLLLLIAAQAIPALAAGGLRAGAAMVEITPELGVPMAGYYHARGASAVHDDLYARALVIERNGITVAMVTLDLISTRRGFVEEARALVEERMGIPRAHVMISATHAHTGPVLTRIPQPAHARDEPNEAALAFMRGLPEKIAQSVANAHAALVDAEALAATGEESSIAFNRRFHMRDGSVGWNPGKLNPNILKPAGPIDPEVPFVFFQDAVRERPLGICVNYAVHLDNVGGDEISADLPYTVTELLRQAIGEDLVTLYTSGACGDLNHVDVTWKTRQKGHENAARMGTILAAEVLKTWPKLEIVDGLLQAKSQRVKLSIPEVSATAVERAKEIVRTTNDRTRSSFMQLVNAHKTLDVAAREGEPFDVEVQVMTLGDSLAWVALPGEIFVELGLDLKMASPFGQTMVVELANDSIGYVPTSRAYRQGAYEVVSARCVRGSGEQLVEAALELLEASFAESSKS